MSSETFTRIVVVIAALLGAVGVIAAAGATHSGDQALLGPLSLIALTHAPTLLVLAFAAPATRLFRLAIVVIGLGAVVFVADLAMRHFIGAALFPMAAPAGGSALILGWLIVAAGGAFGRR
jgi:uncharacterized membrane protein YgdD (TMEM256/DUF423 family)